MNADTGQIRQFDDGYIPTGWTELKTGSVCEINGLFFRIYSVDVFSQQVILKPISRKEFVEDINKKADTLVDLLKKNL